MKGNILARKKKVTEAFFRLDFQPQCHHCSNKMPKTVPMVAQRNTSEERQAAYRELFRHELEPCVVDQIRRATNGNFTLGNQRFKEKIAAMLGRRVTPGKAGRPRKKTEKKEGDG